MIDSWRKVKPFFPEEDNLNFKLKQDETINIMENTYIDKEFQGKLECDASFENIGASMEQLPRLLEECSIRIEIL